MTKCCVSEFAVDTRDRLSPLSFFNEIKQAVAVPEQDTVNLLLLNTCLCNLNQQHVHFSN